MASYTPNYNLYMPANTDPHGDFIAEFANNMEIIDRYLGSGSGGVKILRNQSLSFTGLVATVSDSDITADSNYIVYYHDVTLAENAGITTVASSGVITFTAVTAPSNTIVVDIVLLDVNGGGGGGGSIQYSTTERVIGRWIDNKPLYQITIEVNNPVNDSNEHLIDLTSLNIAECPYLFGYAVRQAGANQITYYSNSIETDGWYYFKARYDNFRSSIMYICLFQNDSIDRMKFTIQYTKVTD